MIIAPTPTFAPIHSPTTAPITHIEAEMRNAENRYGRALKSRSLHRQIVVVDEAQNLEPTTLKTVLTRIGEGTKVIFTGDTSQIDAPYLGESNNALAVLIQAFGGQSCFGHVTLTACERSTVASLAAELL